MIDIYGASDDLVEIDGDVWDEVSPGTTITIGNSQRGVIVRMRYCQNGTWRASVAMIDEGVPMFPVSVIEAAPGGYPNPRSYSVMVRVDCPEGTLVRYGKTTTRTGPSRG